MWVVEYFVGSARGLWVRGTRIFPTREDAEAYRRADFVNEARHYAGVFVRRVVPL